MTAFARRTIVALTTFGLALASVACGSSSSPSTSTGPTNPGNPTNPTSDAPARARTAANWTLGELRRLLNAAGLDVAASRVAPSGLAELLDLMANGTISGKQAKDVLEKAFASAETPGAVVAREGIAQLSDAGELELIVEEVIAENPKAVEDYRAGKTASVQFLIGQVMKRTKGRAKPDILNPLVLGKLDQA